MGQNAQTDRSPRGFITIDWMVLAVACIALLFLLGTLLRTSVDADVIGDNDFQELGERDTLLAFQDFSFDAVGWDPSETSDRLPGIGPALGPFGAEPVQRSFPMPVNATMARITLDLHLLGDWAGQGTFQVSLGEQEVLTIQLPADAEGGAIDFEATQSDSVMIAVQSSTVSPRRLEAALPGARDDFVTLRIGLSVAEPPETLALRFLAEVEGDARWSLDNFTVIATSGDGLTQR